ncbi:hypothetical protein RSSM_03642 [Rhodopirellula sallentina SM41]|uniref:Uncharacterized protein n=1 Tax=Rhodopirellula sallentina SM41 TaxID=1263870 RepID=M5U0C3_9BACT|nr:hypothetical protein RSSM_03642 [Rhodopirellula sallentina SM41]
MVHAYHVILPMYGFWLPNDPRGSWSQFVASWELACFGETTRHLEQRTLAQLTDEELAHREAARKALKYPAVTLNGNQALTIANGFKAKAAANRYEILACSILPEHTHLVIARHRYKIEQVANLLKGAATRQLMEAGIHPLAEFADADGKPPHVWATHQWKAYLDSEEAIETAIAYVIENPLKEGKKRQDWHWLAPYRGLDKGWTTYL